MFSDSPSPNIFVIAYRLIILPTFISKTDLRTYIKLRLNYQMFACISVIRHCPALPTLVYLNLPPYTANHGAKGFTWALVFGESWSTIYPEWICKQRWKWVAHEWTDNACATAFPSYQRVFPGRGQCIAVWCWFPGWLVVWITWTETCRLASILCSRV